MRKVGLLVFGSLCVSILLVPGATAEDCPGLLPDVDGVSRAHAKCTYEHVPFATFSYVDGNLRATWGDGYEVLEAYVVQDWTVVAAYVPGTRIRLPIERERSRYDVLARFKAVDTGRIFNGLTPIWCISGNRIPAALEGCFGGDQALSCSMTESVPCKTGGTAIITCDGDTGTCKSCSTRDMACCEATKKSTVVIGGIVKHETVIEQRESYCTAPPLPKPGDPEGPIKR